MFFMFVFHERMSVVTMPTEVIDLKQNLNARFDTVNSMNPVLMIEETARISIIF